MIILRYVGYALLFCAILLLGTEIVRYLETKTIKLISIQQAWMVFSSESWGDFKNIIADGRFPALWQDVIEPLVGFPLLIVMIIVSLFLVYIGRRSN